MHTVSRNIHRGTLWTMYSYDDPPQTALGSRQVFEPHLAGGHTTKRLSQTPSHFVVANTGAWYIPLHTAKEGEEKVSCTHFCVQWLGVVRGCKA